MAAGSIVERLDVVEDVGTGPIAGLVDTVFDPFLFQTAEERFGYGVIPTVAAPAHARFQSVYLTGGIPS